MNIKISHWDFPGGPVAKTPRSQFIGAQAQSPSLGTSSHMLQLKSSPATMLHLPQLKIPCAATKVKGPA